MVAIGPMLKLSSVPLRVVGWEAEAFTQQAKDVLHVGLDPKANIDAIQAPSKRITQDPGSLLDQAAPPDIPNVMVAVGLYGKRRVR